MSNTLVYKDVVAEIKNKDITIGQFKRLRKAIVEIGNTPIRWLLTTGKVASFTTKGQKMYMYRLSHTERLIFSVSGNKKVIHDFVDINDLKNETSNAY